MSVAMSRSGGVTLLSVTSDQSSPCPPLCQLLGALCYSPDLCSVTRRLTFQRRGAQAALGALWIITGILHIGLGVILITTRGTQLLPVLQYNYTPVWLGVLFMLFGVCCVLAEKYPRPAMVLLSGLLNLTGIGLAITAIVWYSYGAADFLFYCKERYNYNYRRGRYYTPITASPELFFLQQRCVVAKGIMRALSTSIRAVLITLSVLNICLGISSAILSFKALFQGFRKSGNKPQL